MINGEFVRTHVGSCLFSGMQRQTPETSVIKHVALNVNV